jgi:hypothetical protein
MLDDAQLSRELDIIWLCPAVPPFVTICRELAWSEVWTPSPRCFYRAEIIAYSRTRDTNSALRVWYWLANPEDGWHPVPPGDDPHGGRLVKLASVRAASRPEEFVPSVTATQLRQFIARQESGVAAYRQRFDQMNRAPQQPLTGVVMPPSKPGFWARLIGAT